MAKTLRVQKDAQAEFDAAVDWYELEAARGEHFALAVRSTFRRIVAEPESFAVAIGTRTVRHAAVRQCPYRVFFVPAATEILVVAVAHTRRRPRYWRRRVPRR